MSFHVHQPTSLASARERYGSLAGARYLAGGQSLLPALRLGLNDAQHLVDLAHLPGLRGVSVDGDALVIGAMTTHAEVAANAEVRHHIPALATLAAGIGDQQIRNRGTLGGSLANADPAACYPAAVLGLGATLITDQRTLSADGFFRDLFQSALDEGELITAVRFPFPRVAAYMKFKNPASRFALVGVFVSDGPVGVRVAVTGAASAAFRSNAHEQALRKAWAPNSARTVRLSPEGLNSDLHAAADYRAHLVSVLAARAIAATLGTAATSGESLADLGSRQPLVPTASLANSPMQSVSPGTTGLRGRHRIIAPRERVFAALNDVDVLRACIEGCDSLTRSDDGSLAAAMSVRIGPVSVKFRGKVRLEDVVAPERYTLVFEGHGGVAGFARGKSHVQLIEVDSETDLVYEVEAHTGGKLAQLGSRLVEASAQKIAREFFEKFEARLSGNCE